MKSPKISPHQSFFDSKRSLVLGGGAARGMIHLGVYKRLQENEQYPHEVIGTSMGALIGACVALQMPFDQLYLIAQKLHRLKMLSFNLRQGLSPEKKVQQHLSDLFGKQTFAEIKLALTIVSTDLHTSTTVLLTQGKLTDAVRASIAIPGVFEPVYAGEHLLVDGGLSSNLCVESAKYDNILAVSAASSAALAPQASNKKLSKIQLLFKSLLTICNVNESRSLDLVTDKDCILVDPKFPHKFHEFHKVDEMIAIGYDAMEERFGGGNKNPYKCEK